MKDKWKDKKNTQSIKGKFVINFQFVIGFLFQTFLGQKYGYRPFPPKIEAKDFEAILKATQEEEDRKLLTNWFARDDNVTPALYLLQPIRDKLPDYVNDTEPDKKKEVIL